MSCPHALDVTLTLQFFLFLCLEDRIYPTVSREVQLLLDGLMDHVGWSLWGGARVGGDLRLVALKVFDSAPSICLGLE